MGHKSEDPASAFMEARERRRSQELPAELRKEFSPLVRLLCSDLYRSPPSSGLRREHEAQPQSGQG